LRVPLRALNQLKNCAMTELLGPLVTFAVATSVTPGPNNVMITASGANFGFARSVPHMLGVGIGFMVMIVGVGLGLGQVFERAPLLHEFLRYGGALYLLYLAWRIATAAPAPTETRPSSARPLTFLQAALFQWVNPKGG
jgi:threonine/homoserine/homoserine lactone efflux protein